MSAGSVLIGTIPTDKVVSYELPVLSAGRFLTGNAIVERGLVAMWKMNICLPWVAPSSTLTTRILGVPLKQC